jgi:hypothetical protein
MQKKLKQYSPKTMPVQAVSWSFKFIDKELQTQVRASAAGPNPVAQKWKKMKKCSTKTLPVPAVPWASSSLKKSCKHKFIH